MILRKQWATKSDDLVLGSLLEDLKRRSKRALLKHKDELQPETEAAFNLSSIICQTRRWEWPWALKQALEHNDDLMPLRHIKVLDIGSGFRPFTLWLRDFEFDVTALDDLSWNTKEDLAGLFYGHGVNFVNADARDLPFADASFDHSFCISVVEHCERKDIDKIISEGRRVTRPDGLFIVTVDFCEKVGFLLPDEPAPKNAVRNLFGVPAAGIVFSGGV